MRTDWFFEAPVSVATSFSSQEKLTYCVSPAPIVNGSVLIVMARAGDAQSANPSARAAGGSGGWR